MSPSSYSMLLTLAALFILLSLIRPLFSLLFFILRFFCCLLLTVLLQLLPLMAGSLETSSSSAAIKRGRRLESVVMCL